MLYVEPRVKLSLLKVIIALTMIFGTVFYSVDISMVNFPKYLSQRIGAGKTAWNWEVERKQQEHDWDEAYFVNTVGCKMPSFPVNNNQIQKFLSKFVSPVTCSVPLTKSNHSFLWISLNETELDLYYGVKDVNALRCSYTPLYRKSDRRNFLDESKSVNFSYGEFAKVESEFVKVVCKDAINEIYEDHHFFVLQTDNVIPRDGKNKLNIMVIGIDSMSRLNFHRQMNKSVSVMLNNLKAIELFGYNKLEDNTYPNLIPVLTGLDKDEIVDACVPDENSTFDKCHFIWDKYKEQNYTTLFAEDTAWLGLFNYFKGGFRKQPTDYFLRPIIIEMEKSKESAKVLNTFYCLGYKNSFELFVEYVTKFIYSIGSNPYFSFFWSTSYSHDDFLSSQLIDDSFSEFLLNLSSSNALENTFLFVMSDHGLRFGNFRSTYQGMMEERQPALFIIPPTSFPLRYPNALKNLLKNRRQLTTHFDLYETLRDLSEIDLITIKNESIQKRSHELLDTEPMPRGISLFLPIPSSRSCALAGISPHWCTCHEKQELSTTNKKVLKSARLIVEQLNYIVKVFPQCQRLSLNSISNANMFASSADIKGIEKDQNKFSDITVRLQTKPGFGEFEATVRVYNNGSMNMTGTISRINLYGKQSQCVDDYQVKLYCFCNSFL